MTYYGSAKERKAKRQGWSKPNAFHICITSYTLVLQVRVNGLAECSFPSVECGRARCVCWGGWGA